MPQVKVSGASWLAKRVADAVARQPDLGLGEAHAIEVVCDESGGATITAPDGRPARVPDADTLAVRRILVALGVEPIDWFATVLTHSPHADSLEPVFDDDVRFQRVLVPCSRADVLLLKVDLAEPMDPGIVRERLRASPRIVVWKAADGFPDTARVREYFRDLGRRRGDRSETLVWEESVDCVGPSLYLTVDVDPLAGAVPEILDEILARAGGAA